MGYGRWIIGGALLAVALAPMGACSPQGSSAQRSANSAAASAGDRGSQPARRVMRRDQVLMGTRFSVQLVAKDERRAAEALEAAFAEVARVEALISEWRDTSEISAVNRGAADGPVRIGPELYEVIERGLDVADQTDGGFDLTFASCAHLWSFGDRRVPRQSELSRCLPRVDHRAVLVDQAASTVTFGRSGTKIGVGGIGKGYGVDRAAEVLEAHGVTDYVVDGGGDLRVRGRRLDRPWSVGIAHPRKPDQMLATLSVQRGAVVTSGDYERFFEHDGQRYHHIIDPRTGRPAQGSVSVTVIAADATTADALATGLFVLGHERALELVESTPTVEALVVDADLNTHSSSGFERHVVDRIY